MHSDPQTNPFCVHHRTRLVFSQGVLEGLLMGLGVAKCCPITV